MDREYDERYSEEFERCFAYFWTRLVLPTVKLVFNEIDPDFKDKVGLCYAYNDMELYKQDVMAFYREKREWLKQLYLPHESHPRLDQHKLGALWCRTLLAYKPFYFNYKKALQYVSGRFKRPDVDDFSDPEDHSEWFIKNLYANYRAAYLVSTGIVYIYLLFDCKEKREDLADYLKEGGFEFFRAKGGLIGYPTRRGHSDFTNSCIIALEKNDINDRKFDYLTYAIMLYQLEYYNKMHYFMLVNGIETDNQNPPNL